MENKVRWGVLGAAKIAIDKVIPAMQQSAWSEIYAIASRHSDQIRQTALDLGVAKIYKSYDDLLNDPEVKAIYNPLPNHLHVPWTIKAATVGKHVLCEKPLGLNSGEIKKLLAVQKRTGVKIQEAFMVLFG